MDALDLQQIGPFTAEQAVRFASEIAAYGHVVAISYLSIGIVLGFIGSSILVMVWKIFRHGLQRPRRIKFSSTNGNTTDEYLYRFRGRYYTSDQYLFLKSHHKKHLLDTVTDDPLRLYVRLFLLLLLFLSLVIPSYFNFTRMF